MVKTSMAYRLTEGVKVPAAVQLPVDQQDTLHTAAPPFDCRTPAANSAKTPSPHTGSAVADAIEWETTTSRQRLRSRSTSYELDPETDFESQQTFRILRTRFAPIHAS